MIKFSWRNRSGFTMVELMIAVAVVSVLVAVGVPQYGMFLMKTKRTEGIVIISAVHKAQQSYYAERNVYVNGAEIFFREIGFSAVMDAKYYKPSFAFNQADVVNNYQAYHSMVFANLDQTDSHTDTICMDYPYSFFAGIVNPPIGQPYILYDDITDTSYYQ